MNLCLHNIILIQVKEEFEVFDNSAPILVYSHPPGPHKTFYKVSPYLVSFKYILIWTDVLQWPNECIIQWNFSNYSSKFSQKIKYVYSLTDLAELVPMEYVSIPDCIKQ